MPVCPTTLTLQRLLNGPEVSRITPELQAHVDTCDTCGAWLDAHDGQAELIHDLQHAVRRLPAASHRLDAHPGLERFRVLGVLGRGGMGIVYDAEQDKPKRRVAIKVLQAHAATPRGLRRFDLEAEALGRLDHPCIARVFESGAFVGPEGPSPYLVLERVEGVDLVQHVRDGGLTISEVVELVCDVCTGVRHAHRRGVLHRDLKPSNVLVDGDGRPKILDFGVARLLDRDARDGADGATQPGQTLGTLAYMSPEQMRGEVDQIDTRTDVYSLGAILFELCADRPPLDLGDVPFLEAARRIEHDIPDLSDQPARIPEDLRRIITKALAKERDERYGSVEALSEDLTRFLAREPVEAHPPSLLYRLRKSMDRNRRAYLAGAAAGVVLAAGTVSLLGERQRTTRAEERAALEQNAAASLGTLLDRILTTANPFAEGTPVDSTVTELLHKLANELESSQTLEPLAQIRVRATLGRAYLGLGQLERAREQLEERERLARRHLSTSDPQRTEAALDLCYAALKERRYDTAFEGLAAIGDDLPPRLRVRFLHVRSQALLARWALEESRAELMRAIVLAETAEGLEPRDVARLQLQRATLEDVAENEAAALEAARRALDMLEASLGPGHPTTAAARHRFANALLATGSLDAGGAAFESAAQALAESLGESTVALAHCLRDWARLEVHRRNPAAAIALYERACAALPTAPNTMHARACYRIEQAFVHPAGDERDALLDEAEHLFDLDAGRPFDREHPVVRLAKTLNRSGRYDLSEQLYRSVLANVDDTPEDELLTLRSNLAATLFRQAKWDEAEAIYADQLDLRRRILEPDSNRIASAAMNLAATRLRAGHAEGTEELLREALAISASNLGDDHARTTRTRRHLAQSMLQQGRANEALALLTPWMDIIRRQHRADSEALGDTLLLFGECLAATGRDEEARRELQEARSIFERLPFPPADLLARAARGLTHTAGH